ncbi:hypothetical protein H3C61_00580 [Candidatus Gracilibacteria bacterium]|nr:hypothetical protein [Candidatus Gracilibacteria bacterium]
MNKLKYILGITLIFFLFTQTGIGYELQTKLKRQIDILVDKKVTEKNAPKILQKIDNINKSNFSEAKKEAYNYIYKKVEEKFPKKTKNSNQKTSSGIILEQNSSSGSKNNKNDTINQNATEINYNDKKYQTQIENYYGKGLAFIDSTKIYEEGKVLFNGHWYFLQSDEYYEEMNKNKTPIKVAGSFGNDKKVYNTEEKGFVFSYPDGGSSVKSGNIQKQIDLIRYNDNFYFQDVYLIKEVSLEKAPQKIDYVFGAEGISSIKEFFTISNSLLNNLENFTIKEYLDKLGEKYNNVSNNSFLFLLNLK